MKLFCLPALSCLLTIGIGEAAAAEPEFAHFLEPGFPFAEIVVDARKLGEGFPDDNLTPRGLVVRLAEDTYIAYDTDLCRVACAWKGGFLTEESLATMSYHKAKKKKGGGQKVLPSPIGTPIFATGLYPGVQIGSEPKFEDPRPAGKDPKEIGRGAVLKGKGNPRWLGAKVFGGQVVVSYELGGIVFSEIPWLSEGGGIGRVITIGKHPEEMVTMILGNGPGGIRWSYGDGIRHALTSPHGIGTNTMSLDKTDEVRTLTLLYELPGSDTEEIPAPPAPSFDPHWGDSLSTSGELQSAIGAYAVDSIPLPTDNLWRRNVRPSGIDFFPDGRAAVVTFDGDVWIVSGLDAKLADVRWKRIAGGLHEPNSVRICDGKDIFVFGRNGVTQLIDSDGDGETNTYYNHCSDFWQSAETRDFAHSMDIARDGSFYVTKGGQQNDFASKHSGRALKISPDGKEVSVFASGLRNAYLAIRPGTDEVYASDQQGHWVPATPIHRLVEGGYYGFKPAAPWGVPEPEITPPLCWIPHVVAGSGLGPVWSDKQRFGPLSDSLVYLDFRRPGMLRTYLNDRDGQAATVPMGLDFDFPLLKGAVNPVDGQLYVVGFQIWGTSAKKVRGMARVRYTGKPSVLPTRVVAGKNAIALRFEQALDPSVASFTLRRWNYKRSAGYGSGHYRPDGKAGEELLPLGGVEFSADRRSVLIATPELKPVQQLAIGFDLKTSGGQLFSNAAYLTLHQVSALDLKEAGFPDVDLAKMIAQIGSATPAEKQDVIPTAQRGAVVYQTIGCAGCHSVDGSKSGKSGPTWKGLAGSMRVLQGGEKVEATAKYLRESILDPAAMITKGYNPKDVGMPSYRGILPDADIESLILYIESLAKKG